MYGRMTTPVGREAAPVHATTAVCLGGVLTYLKKIKKVCSEVMLQPNKDKRVELKDVRSELREKELNTSIERSACNERRCELS